MENDNLAKDMGERIRKLRNQCGVTQFELSEAIDVSPSFLGLVERGVRKLSTKKILRLCNFFKVSTDCVLLGEKECSHEPTVRENFISQSLNKNESEFIFEVSKILIIKRLGKAELNFILGVLNSYVVLVANNRV